jgi:peptidyl-tRNA hydrolase
MADIVKQVIVVNMAVPFPIGRLMAHAAHASVSNILKRGSWTTTITDRPSGETKYIYELHTKDAALKWWMEEQFTKVVCKAWGKEAMMKIKAQAEEKGIYVSVMEEEGFVTAIALGPALIKDLEFTKQLSLM